MLKNILKLEGAQKLTNNEQKSISGGKVASFACSCNGQLIMAYVDSVGDCQWVCDANGF
ncbi:hypothetical protein [Flavobacterium frigoris]|uniref:Uncharacterized protein n=1 Tax=Flavobacterium frigoris TaxID=229204 RepID=A0A1H9NTU8_FLAFI|nr:hypothetical protein [Flavobacterium frigoris]SER38753.1 hypothetical protein SAMN05444355_11175 [Flavobacterium frigoris]